MRMLLVLMLLVLAVAANPEFEPDCELRWCTASSCASPRCELCKSCGGPGGRPCKSDPAKAAECASWCNPIHQTTHCGDCGCEGCDFCRTQATAACTPFNAQDAKVAQCSGWCDPRYK